MRRRDLARVVASLAIAIAIAGCGSRVPPGYPVPARVGAIVTDAAAFHAFATAVRPDLERDATSTDPEIRKSRLFVIAMLDALDDRWDAAIAALDRVAALEATPAAKAMVGLTLRVHADARAGSVPFRDALAARVDRLPRAELREPLAMLRTMGQTFTPEICAQLVDAEVAPRVVHGRVPIGDAHAIVFQRYAVVYLVPVGKDIDEVLAARGIDPAH